MSKYVVKNCPCYWHIGEDDGCSLENMKSCEDDTDCLLKKIVEKCAAANKECNCTDVITDIDCVDCTDGGKAKQASEILDLLDLEECE